jgi:hypothetical protein
VRKWTSQWRILRRSVSRRRPRMELPVDLRPYLREGKLIHLLLLVQAEQARLGRPPSPRWVYPVLTQESTDREVS